MCVYLVSLTTHTTTNVDVTLKCGRFMGRSRSLKMAPMDRSYTTYYWFAIVSITLSCTIFELFDVENTMTLKYR